MARTASATVYDILQRNIMNLTLIPGTPMSEKDISEKMSVSRTPVREAFIRLSKEALVSIIPQKGSFVSRISLFKNRIATYQCSLINVCCFKNI